MKFVGKNKKIEYTSVLNVLNVLCILNGFSVLDCVLPKPNCSFIFIFVSPFVRCPGRGVLLL